MPKLLVLACGQVVMFFTPTGSPRRLCLGSTLSFIFLYMLSYSVHGTSNSNPRRWLGVGVWSLEASHQGMVVQGAKRVTEVQWEECVDKKEKV